MPAESTELLTAEGLLAIDIPGKSTELVRGYLIVREPPSTYHGVVSMRLGSMVQEFVRKNDLGVVCGQDTGFKIRSNPDTVRAPDVAFVAKHRAPSIPRRGYAALAPDLVAEVVSPDDRPGELLAKVGDWLEAGVRLVWVIDPPRGEAHVHRPDGSISVLIDEETLDGEDVLPGFHCTVSELL
jgi:Uma2 family endonuclease